MSSSDQNPPAVNDLPLVLTVEEAAMLLCVGRSKVYAMARAYVCSGGTSGLPVVVLGTGTFRVPRSGADGADQHRACRASVRRRCLDARRSHPGRRHRRPPHVPARPAATPRSSPCRSSPEAPVMNRTRSTHSGMNRQVHTCGREWRCGRVEGHDVARVERPGDGGVLHAVPRGRAGRGARRVVRPPGGRAGPVR